MPSNGGAESSSSGWNSRLRRASNSKYCGSRRLALGDDVDEGVLVHRLQRVVGLALLADVELVSLDRCLPHDEPAPWAGRPRLVGQDEQLVVQGAVEMPRHRVDRQLAAGSDQVGTADVADEQRVTGQHAVRNVVVGMFVHHEADRLRRMSRGGQDLDRDLAQRQSLPVSKEVDREPELGTDAIGDDRAGVAQRARDGRRRSRRARASR